MCEKVAAMRQLVVYSIEFDVFVPFSFSYSYSSRIRRTRIRIRLFERFCGKPPAYMAEYGNEVWRKGENLHSDYTKEVRYSLLQ